MRAADRPPFHLLTVPDPISKYTALVPAVQVIRFTWATGGTLAVVLLILWPLLALPAGIFSQGYFT